MRLNNKGFAISGILYSMFILVITLMFLVLAILAGRRTTLNKIGRAAASSIEDRVVYKVTCSEIEWGEAVLYSGVSEVAGGGPGHRPGGGPGHKLQFNGEIEVELDEGYYLIQAWGAQGAPNENGAAGNKGGLGAYVSAIYYADEDQTIYLNIGHGGDDLFKEQVNTPSNIGGLGSADDLHGAGGGATFVATSSGIIDSMDDNEDDIILIAAGGGGAGNKLDGGYGGNLEQGGDGEGAGDGAGMGSADNIGGIGGTDPDSAKSGKDGSLGKGGNAGENGGSKAIGGGGGAGYYGGGGAAASNTNHGGGGGGLSYINNEILSFTKAILTNGDIFNTSGYKDYVGVAISGNSTMPEPQEHRDHKILTKTMHDGNKKSGYVRITPLVCSE